MNIFKRKYHEYDILNIGLDFAMEFGKNWLQPIQSRLHNKINYLSDEDLNKYNTICKNVLDEGVKLLYKLCDDIDPKFPVKNDDLFNQWKVIIHEKYPWINLKNLNHLYSQANYYSWKDGNSHGKIL